MGNNSSFSIYHFLEMYTMMHGKSKSKDIPVPGRGGP
jgi:hypothetical protein